MAGLHPLWAKNSLHNGQPGAHPSSSWGWSSQVGAAVCWVRSLPYWPWASWLCVLGPGRQPGVSTTTSYLGIRTDVEEGSASPLRL